VINMTKDDKRIYLSAPHMGGTEEKYVKEAFDSNWIAPLGPHVDRFEKEVADFVCIKAAVALSSGTAAMHLALKYLGITRGDRVFCSSLTFAASCNPIIYEGGIPVFIDSERSTWNMSPKALERAFIDCDRKRVIPKAVIVVNLYGQSADMDRIKEICDSYGVPIIEDAAESLGATYKGRYSGTIGDFGVYSFNGNKIITTGGGGMLVSNNEEALKKARFWATQSRDPVRHYQHSELGYNYRLSNVLAAIGRGQLEVLQERIRQKKNIYETYRRELGGIKALSFMPIAEFGQPNYWLTVVTLNSTSKIKPLDIMIALEKENIEARPLWKPMHLQPFYEGYEFYSHKDEGISISEELFNSGLCLPSDTRMTEEELQRVISVVLEVFND
jgi:dTDP-4-amino-4,6-dideoxygalactose transaminase